MSDIAGLAASAAGGGLFGLIGTVLGRVATYAERRQAHAQEQARWAHESALQRLEMEAAQQKVSGELAKAETEGRWQGLTASQSAEAAIAPSYKWVDAVRGLTRPVLTFTLWVVTGGIYLAADGIARDQIAETATFAATAATLWWFGDRGPHARYGAAPSDVSFKRFPTA